MEPQRQAFLHSLSALAEGESLVGTPDDLSLLLEAGNLNSLVCDNSYVKAFLLAGLSMSFLSRGKVVCVVDLDTHFTAYVEDHPDIFDRVEDLAILRPTRRGFDDAVAELCSTTSPDLGLVVLDSVTSFYHFASEDLPGPSVITKLAVVLQLLRMAGGDRKIPIVVTSLVKPRIGVRGEHGGAAISYSGERLLSRMSRVVLFERLEGDMLAVTAGKHTAAAAVGRRLLIRLA